jgi:hypothetical protein
MTGFWGGGDPGLYNGFLTRDDRLMSLFQGLSQAGARMATPGASRGQSIALGLAGLGEGIGQGNQAALMRGMFGLKMGEAQRQAEQKKKQDEAQTTFLKDNPQYAGVAAANPTEFFKTIVDRTIPKLPENRRLGETRNFQQGDKIVTQEWDGKAWTTLGEGPKWEQPWLNNEYIKAQQAIRAAGKSDVNVRVDTAGPGAFYKELGEGAAKDFRDAQGKAHSAISAIQTGNIARGLLDDGVITGTGADFRLGLGKALATAKLTNGDSVANTEAFMSTMGRVTLDLVKQLGAGSGISNADRDYAAMVAGGRIDMSENGIRRLLDINDRVSRRFIDDYNKRAVLLKDDERLPEAMRKTLMVESPAAYERKAPKANGGAAMRTFSTPQEMLAAKLPSGTAFYTGRMLPNGTPEIGYAP